MRTLRAFLLFPVRAAASAPVLSASRSAWAAPVLPACAVVAYLLLRGCGVADASAAGGTLLLLLAAAGLGGAAALGAARLVVPRAPGPGRMAAPCLVCAAWAPVLFLVVQGVAAWAGAGRAAALAAGLAVLVWGIGVGMGLLADAAADAGRALVASCLGMTGALLGLWLGLATVPGALVTAVPVPADLAGLAAGDLVLVRAEDSPPAGSLVLLAGRGREAVFARAGPDGGFDPLGVEKARIKALAPLRPQGRIFFRFGGAWGGRALAPEKPENGRAE